MYPNHERPSPPRDDYQPPKQSKSVGDILAYIFLALSAAAALAIGYHVATKYGMRLYR
jgi:hypothetical protein